MYLILRKKPMGQLPLTLLVTFPLDLTDHGFTTPLLLTETRQGIGFRHIPPTSLGPRYTVNSATHPQFRSS